MILHINQHDPDITAIERAADVLHAGGVIIYPTDTVYGLGCSIAEKDAIQRTYLIKQERIDRPFSFVCSDLKHISEYAHVSNMAFRVMKHLIPGPYTFILPAAKMKHLPKILVSRRKTVGIRVPNNKVTLELVRRVGHPILSTSVSSNGGPPITAPENFSKHFRNSVDLILDAGILLSEPSTVLDLTGESIEVVRQGAGDISQLPL